MVWFVGILLFLTVFWGAYAVVNRLLTPRLVVAERASFYTRRREEPKSSRASGIQDAFGRLWERVDVEGSLEALLDQAAVPIAPAEFWMISLGAAVVIGGAALLVSRALAPSVLLAIVGLSVPLVWVRVKRRRRRVLFEQQLPDALTAMSGSLRAGFGFGQALSAVVRDRPAPLSEEFERAVREMQLGTGVDDVLRNLVRRNGSRDLDLAVAGILICRQTGGNLAELLDKVSMTLRGRTRLKQMVRVLTAQQRLSVWIVLAIPPLAMAALFFGLPGYLDLMLSTGVGKALLAISLVMQILGMYFFRRIVVSVVDI